jgi:hypothetical protein
MTINDTLSEKLHRTLCQPDQVWPHDSWHCHRHLIGYCYGLNRERRIGLDLVEH